MNQTTRKLIQAAPAIAFALVYFTLGIKAGIITFLVLAPATIVLTRAHKSGVSLVGWAGTFLVPVFVCAPLFFDGLRLAGHTISAARSANSPAVEPLAGQALKDAIREYGENVSFQIEEAISYPPALQGERAEGTVELGLVFDTHGVLQEVVTIRSSKNSIIDASAVNTVKGIKFRKPPAGATPPDLRFGIKMRYLPPPDQ